MTLNMALESFVRASQVTLEQTSNKVDHFSLTYADYAYKAGAWRLLDLMDEFKIKGSVSTNGLTGERHPKVVREFADFGCEIVGTAGRRTCSREDDDPETELAEMRKVTQVLTEVAGTRPIGWVSQGSAGSSNTLDFLKSEGYLWSGDDMSDDLPFLKQTKHGPIVILPRVNLPHNDLWMWATARNPPDYMWHRLEGDVRPALRRRARRRAEMVRTDLARPHGRAAHHDPGCASDADNTRRKHKGVWFTRRRDIAEWTMEHEKAQRSNRMKTSCKSCSPHCARPCAGVRLCRTADQAQVRRVLTGHRASLQHRQEAVCGRGERGVRAVRSRSNSTRMALSDARPSNKRRWCWMASPISASSCRRLHLAAFPTPKSWSCPVCFRISQKPRMSTPSVQVGCRSRDYGDYVPIAMWATPPFSLHSNFPIASLKDLKGKKGPRLGHYTDRIPEGARRRAGRHATDRSSRGAGPHAPSTPRPPSRQFCSILASTASPAITTSYGSGSFHSPWS